MSNVINLFKPQSNRGFVMFDTATAEVMGIEAAILLAYLHDQLSDEDRLVEYGSRWWRPILHKKLTAQFPFWSINKIMSIMRLLSDRGYLEVARPTQPSKANYYLVTEKGWEFAMW